MANLDSTIINGKLSVVGKISEMGTDIDEMFASSIGISSNIISLYNANGDLLNSINIPYGVIGVQSGSGSSTNTTLSGTTITVTRNIYPVVQSPGYVYQRDSEGDNYERYFKSGTVTTTAIVPTQSKTASAAGTINPDSGKLLSSVSVPAGSISFSGSGSMGSATSSTTITANATSPSNKGVAVNYNDNKCGGSSEASYYVTIGATGSGGANAGSYSTTYTIGAGWLAATTNTSAKSGTISAVSTTSSDTNYIKANNTSSVTVTAGTLTTNAALADSQTNAVLEGTNNSGIAIQATSSGSATAGSGGTISCKDQYMLNNVTYAGTAIASASTANSATKYLKSVTVPSGKTLGVTNNGTVVMNNWNIVKSGNDLTFTYAG